MLRRLKDRLVAGALQAFADWAVSKNAPGACAGEDDKRWAYTIETDGSPYLTRILLSNLFGLRKLFGVGIFIHKFHRPDIDEHCHNHPWARAFSVILAGEYVEERVDQVVERVVYMPPSHELALHGQLETVRETLTDTKVVRRFNSLTKDDYHRVLELRGDVWTLFITTDRVQDWGFLVDGEHVPWRKYLGLDAQKEAA